MNQAVVIDGYSFVGFAVCKQLLNEGNQVLLLNALNDEYADEKQLSVGRNANLTEVDINSLKTLLEDEATVFIDGYSMYIKNIEIESFLAPLLDLKLLHQTRCVITLPIQWLHTGAKHKEWVEQTFNNRTIYYLPTVYGPFQPEEMLFQQKLMHASLDKRVGEKEWQKDAVYIDEVVKCIISDLKDGELSGEKIIYSGIEHHWQQCVDRLQIKLDDHIIDDAKNIKSQLPTIKIENHLSVEKALSHQRRHVDILM